MSGGPVNVWHVIALALTGGLLALGGMVVAAWLSNRRRR